MKKKILVILALIVVLVGVIAINFLVPADSYHYAVSDKVTAPDPNWPTPAK